MSKQDFFINAKLTVQGCIYDFQLDMEETHTLEDALEQLQTHFDCAVHDGDQGRAGHGIPGGRPGQDRGGPDGDRQVAGQAGVRAAPHAQGDRGGARGSDVRASRSRDR